MRIPDSITTIDTTKPIVLTTEDARRLVELVQRLAKKESLEDDDGFDGKCKGCGASCEWYDDETHYEHDEDCYDTLRDDAWLVIASINAHQPLVDRASALWSPEELGTLTLSRQLNGDERTIASVLVLLDTVDAINEVFHYTFIERRVPGTKQALEELRQTFSDALHVRFQQHQQALRAQREAQS